MTFRALLNATDDAMFLIDTKGIFLALNDTLANRLSKSKEDLLGKCVFDLLPPESATLRYNWVKHAIQTGESIQLEDKRDGLWLENMIYPIIDNTGSVTMLAICSRNITDRKYSEQERENLIEQLQEYIQRLRPSADLSLYVRPVKR